MKFLNALAIVSSLRIPALAAGDLRGGATSTLGEDTMASLIAPPYDVTPRPTPRPTIAAPIYGGTPRPTRPPTSPPTTCELSCKTDYDCPRICHKDNYFSTGTCVTGVPTPTPPPGAPSTPSPTTCVCKDPSDIPDKCEVAILIDMMETAVLGDHALLAQWTRAAFHDAGTFDQTGPEGGANGCLLTHLPMRAEPENAFLDPPLNTLQAIKDAWHASPFTCIKVSSADMLQFAIFFATTRQKEVPESLLSTLPLSAAAIAKRDTLINDFLWGRPDETDCQTHWTLNLPGFTTPASGGPIPGRCAGAGDEIEEKMMTRNGFTAEEATVLIGAHTIGLVRNTFGPVLAGPWVTNGADNATPDGPIFDNAYHDFLINTIVENNAFAFAGNVAPFTDPAGIFPDWFRDFPNDLDHLDTDVTLAFPSTGAHPDFSVFTANFASSNDVFLKTFFQALKKMSQLGVTAPLFPAGPCEDFCDGADGGITLAGTLSLIKKLGNATAHADMAILETQEGRKDEIDRLTTPVSETTFTAPVSETTSTSSTGFSSTTKTYATRIIKPRIEMSMAYDMNGQK